MNPKQIMDEYLGVEVGNRLLDTPTGLRLYTEVGNEGLTEPLLASAFWGILTSSPYYTRILYQNGASPYAVSRGDNYIIFHGQIQGEYALYDLLVLDPRFHGNEYRVATIEPNYEELRFGWERWDEQVRSRWRALQGGRPYASENTEADKFLHYIQSFGPEFATEALKNKPFNILIAPMPEIIYTASPSPAWSVVLSQGGLEISTAGVLAKSKQTGRVGVTIALHSLNKSNSGIVPGATKVWIEGVEGTVRNIDYITDSAFVELDMTPQWVKTFGNKGPLINVGPKAYEKVTFEGIVYKAQRKTGHVIGNTTGLTFGVPLMQQTIMTEAITEEGDSGAACVNDDDHVIGFALSRTGLGSPMEFSVWTWADSVYKALGIS